MRSWTIGVVLTGLALVAACVPEPPAPDVLKTITKVTVPGQPSLVVIVSTPPIDRVSASTEV